MGIALLTLSSFFQDLTRRHRTAKATTSLDHPVRASRIALPSGRPMVRSRPMTSICTQRPATLRVVRVRDEHGPAHEVGRMVISGRMADVCAELDRLVAREAAMQQAGLRH